MKLRHVAFVPLPISLARLMLIAGWYVCVYLSGLYFESLNVRVLFRCCLFGVLCAREVQMFIEKEISGFVGWNMGAAFKCKAARLSSREFYAEMQFISIQMSFTIVEGQLQYLPVVYACAVSRLQMRCPQRFTDMFVEYNILNHISSADLLWLRNVRH